MLQRFFRVFTPPELTVLSFLFASLFGGFILYATEYKRTVIVNTPIAHIVRLDAATTSRQLTNINYPREELHTDIEKHSLQGERFIDAVFTAVSALCVTGLTSTDFSQFTLLGQIVTLILIQMGGLGIIVFTSMFAFAIFRGLSEHQNFTQILSSIVDVEHHFVKRMIKHVMLYTFVIEASAALVIGARLAWFRPVELASASINPWWFGLFHSISAFNNAGFGLLDSNLVIFANDPIINTVIMLLIILGGMGYPVLILIHTWLRSKFHRKDLSYFQEDIQMVASPVQTRVALIGTLVLVFGGALITLFLEADSSTLGASPSSRIWAALFQSVSTRTAGFNTIDIGALRISTLFFYMVLMFIGANPAGTAGGIKIPTVAVLWAYIKDWFLAPGLPIRLFKKTISKFALSHAIRLFFMSVLFVFLIIFMISAIEAPWLATPDPVFNFGKIMFEVFSAFGTVGLSMGFPGSVTSFSAILSDTSKWLIIFTMLVGRLGPLTILAAMPWKRRYAHIPLTNDHSDVTKLQIG